MVPFLPTLTLGPEHRQTHRLHRQLPALMRIHLPWLWLFKQTAIFLSYNVFRNLQKVHKSVCKSPQTHRVIRSVCKKATYSLCAGTQHHQCLVFCRVHKANRQSWKVIVREGMIVCWCPCSGWLTPMRSTLMMTSTHGSFSGWSVLVPFWKVARLSHPGGGSLELSVFLPDISPLILKVLTFGWEAWNLTSKGVVSTWW